MIAPRRFASLAEAEKHGLGGVMDYAAQVAREGPPAPPDEFLLEAMREVDALTPACPPIAPPPVRPDAKAPLGSPAYDAWLRSLVPPDAPAAEIYAALNIRTNQYVTDGRPPPPPAPTRAPGPGTRGSR